MENKRGLFIVIEGVDGSGKSTQASLLADYLRGLGRRVHHTAEPTESGLGGMVRDGLGGEHPRTTEELAAMFLADRVAHNVSPKSGIKQYLESGTDVVCDRYYYSSLAYQGVDGALQWVADMNLNSPVIEKPDICIFIDLDPEKCLEHIRAGRSHFEIYEENSAIIAETRRRYGIVFEMLKGRDNIVTVDGARTPKEVSADVIAAVSKLLK
ncbi:MAG: dTMP kinase [Oscillospiraceae bacterium]